MATTPTRQPAKDELAESLRPSVEQALYVSARENSVFLTDALYPVIAPSIAHAIRQALAEMVDNLSRILERSLSWRGVAWRWEAWRTGRPLGEIAYLHSIVYSVEQVLLIHRHTGLLLRQAARPSAASPNSDVVSGMITAIRDFVRDSFNTDRDAPVDLMRVGDLTVHVEQGPQALLAAVVRGTLTPDVNDRIRKALEQIHKERARDLLAFNGDQPFPDCSLILEPLLESRQRADEKPSPRRLILMASFMAILICAALAWWGVLMNRWNGYVAAVRAMPGIVVTSAHRGLMSYSIAGLMDPAANDPTALLAAHHLDRRRLAQRWEPFLSLAPEMVSRRVRTLIHPPGGALLRFQDGTLYMYGAASFAWANQAQTAALFQPGILRVDSTELHDPAFDEAKGRLESLKITFPSGSVKPETSQTPQIEGAANTARALLASGRVTRIEVLGHADPTGTEQFNGYLSKGRSEAVSRLLAEHGIPAEMITGGTGAEKTRAVTFTVLIEPRPR